MKRLLSAAAVLAILAAAVATTSATAAKPRAIHASWLCNPFNTSLAPTSRLLGSSTARGDQAREPRLADTAEEVPAYAGSQGAGFAATVDVYVHSVTDGSIGAVTNADVAKQIQVLNNGLQRPGRRVPDRPPFELAGLDRVTTPSGSTPGLNVGGAEMKKALHQGDASDLNIYLTTAGAYLGWAYFPSTYKTKPWIDGIVIDWASMFRTSTLYKGEYDLGKTATHEAGHWLGLYHVFQGGCNGRRLRRRHAAAADATRGCPEGQDSCNEPGSTPIHNYMDYSYDSCYNEFTAGQRRGCRISGSTSARTAASRFSRPRRRGGASRPVFFFLGGGGGLLLHALEARVVVGELVQVRERDLPGEDRVVVR